MRQNFAPPPVLSWKVRYSVLTIMDSLIQSKLQKVFMMHQLVDLTSTVLKVLTLKFQVVGRIFSEILAVRYYQVMLSILFWMAWQQSVHCLQRGGGLLVNGIEGYVGDIMIENNAFVNNSAQFGGAISFFRGDRITIRNNLITINHSVAGSAVEAVSNDAYGLRITNNTIYLNTSDSTSDLNASGLYVAVNGLSQALIVNNIIWGNDNKDLRLSGNGNKYLKYNNVEFIQGAASVEIGNFPDQPVFEPGFFSYTPQYNSPLVEGGIKPPTIVIIPVPFESNWSLGDSDMAGNPRVQYNKVDIGAFESPHGDLIFIDGFE